MSDTIYIIIIAELLFVCAFCGFMVYRLKQRLSRLAKRLNPAMAKGADGSPVDTNVIAYFVSQLRKTRALPETELGTELALNPLITSVRCAYLNAEKRALKQTEDSKEYWLILKEELNKLLGMLSTEAKRTGTENTELREKLKLLKDRLEKLGDTGWLSTNTKKTIPTASPDAKGYMLRFARGIDMTSQSATKAAGSGTALFEKIEQQKVHTKNLALLFKDEKQQNNLEVRIAEYERMLYKMEHESADLQKALKEAQQRLAQVDNAINAKGPIDKQNQTLLSVIRASKDGNEENDNLFDDLITDTQNIGAQSRKNIDGLQKTIFAQRKSILSMENTISALEAELTGTSVGDDKKRHELDQLKRALMESEGCTKVLENEVENLYANLTALQKQREELQAHYSEKSDDEILTNVQDLQEQAALESAVDGLVKSTLNAEFLTNFMTNAIESGSLEDLITVLQMAVLELGFQSIIRLTVNKHNVDIAAMGQLSKEDKLLIDRIEFRPGEEIKSSKSYTSLHFRNSRAILQKKGKKDQTITSEQQQYLHALFSFSSNLAGKVAAQKSIAKRLDNYEYFNEMLQTISANLESQYRYQREETQSIVQSIIDQSHMLVGEKATPGQQSVLKSMEEEATQRTELLEANRAIVRKQFTKIMEKLKAINK